MKASDLINAAKQRAPARALPPKALAELKLICDHNDKSPAAKRVRIEDVLKMLAAYDVRCTTSSTLNVICREQLGRQSWAKK